MLSFQVTVLDSSPRAAASSISERSLDRVEGWVRSSWRRVRRKMAVVSLPAMMLEDVQAGRALFLLRD